MMEELIDYQVAISFSIAALRMEIGNWATKGYKPQGGICACPMKIIGQTVIEPHYFQAMVKVK